MQVKIEHKSKPTYSSLKQYESIKQPPKFKPKAAKSTKKSKTAKTSQLTSTTKTIKKHKNNQNFSSANLPSHQSNKMRPENQDKKDNKVSHVKNNSQEKLVKSRSMGRLQMKTDRHRYSPSPISRQEPADLVKVSRNLTSRPSKEKKTNKPKEEAGLKKSLSRAIISKKEQITDRNHHNRISMKTEISSKTHSVIKEDTQRKSVHKKSKKNTKKQLKIQNKYKMPSQPKKQHLNNKVHKSILYSQVSFQQCNEPCQSALDGGQDRFFLPYPATKVKTEGYQSDADSLRQVRNRAATIIQKNFRGFITRKYIQEAKFIIGKVKIIQNWWRKILLRVRKPHPSVSLITIKDFNQTFKTQRQRPSESKQNQLSSHKIHLKQLIKNVLQEQSHEQSSKGLEKSQEKVLNKQVYFQKEIRSEKLFNSPRTIGHSPCAKTPKSSHQIRDFFNNSAQQQKQKVKEILQSPKLKSPQPIISISPQKQTPMPRNNNIMSFQTNFAIIQAFAFMLVNFFREKPEQFEAFIDRMNRLSYFRTQLILKNWNTKTLTSDSVFDQTIAYDYQLLQTFQKPVLFSKQLRTAMLQFPQIEIELNGIGYDLDSQLNGKLQRYYIDFIFDALEEGFYEFQKNKIVRYGYDGGFMGGMGEEIRFEQIFANVLGQLCKWSQVFCGLMTELGPELEGLKDQRMTEFVHQIESWDMGTGSQAAIKLQLASIVQQQLWIELLLELA